MEAAASGNGAAPSAAAARFLAGFDWARWEPDELATLLFIVRGGRVLLIEKHRGLGEGKINGPGGRIEPGETAEAAAVREVEEEVLVRPTGVRRMGELRFQFTNGHAIGVEVFRADGCIGEPGPTEEATPLWADLDAIPYDRMWEDDAVWLPLLLRGEPFSGRFVFDEDRMLESHLEPSPAAPSVG